MSLQEKLTELGLALPVAPKPVAAYVPVVRTGDLIFISGQLPMANGQLLATGPVPSKVTPEAAQVAARQCALNLLAILGDQIDGDFSRVVRVVKLGVFVQCDDGYAGQPAIANGASELLAALLGDAGKHARAATGTNSLPLNATVEIDAVVEVR